METTVRKATRLEYLPPKQKHLTTLKNLTFENPASINGILLSLEKRLKERSWIITYKVLVIVHYLMREGNCVQVVESVIKNPSVLDSSRIKNKTSSPASVQNIYLYRAYLDERVIAFRLLKRDYVKESSSSKEGRLRHLSVANGLLKETAALQRQIENVLKCKFYLDEKDPSITLFAYRMTIEDLLALFQAVNEGVVNILEHYFEMNKTDAAEALRIYKRFARQTELTIDYLKEARKLQNDLQMNIPVVNHAPLSLVTALEEYLNDNSSAPSRKSKDQSKALLSPINTNMFEPVQQSLNQTFTSSQQHQPQAQSFTTQLTQYQPQTIFNQNYSAEAQNDLFLSNSDAYNLTNQSMMNAFVPAPQQSTYLPFQSSSPNSNPFLTMMNQQPQPQSNALNSFSNSSYLNHQQTGGYGTSPIGGSSNNALSYVTRSNTFSVGSNNIINNSNPFRSLSINQQPAQQIAVAKPAPYQLSTPTASPTTNHNPFSPATPPLTPNRQSSINNSNNNNNNNNIFLVPYQQQQQQSNLSPTHPAPNPFLIQQ